MIAENSWGMVILFAAQEVRVKVHRHHCFQLIVSIDLLISTVQARMDQRLTLSSLATLIDLSPERARHLFREVTGIPFSQFVLWKRIRNTILLTLCERKSLTEACVAFGFADQAHFCNTFSRIFGTSTKVLPKNSRNIQFLIPQT
jgi:AraC-like DNA-binding protein